MPCSYAFSMGCSGHQTPGCYADPADKSIFHNKLSYWTDTAKLLEAGKFDGIFLADVRTDPACTPHGSSLTSCAGLGWL